MHTNPNWLSTAVRRWRLRHTTTFEALCHATARRLEQELSQHHMDSPERTRLTTMIALNRIGALTLGAQSCSTQPDGNRRTAVIEVIADQIIKDWMEEALYNAGVSFDLNTLEVHGPDSHDPEPAPGQPVAWDDDGRPTHRMGAQLTEDTLDQLFPVPEPAKAELRRRWLVTVFSRSRDCNEMFLVLRENSEDVHDAVKIATSCR